MRLPRFFRLTSASVATQWCVETRDWLLAVQRARPHRPQRRRVGWMRTWSVGFLSLTRL